MRVLLLGPYFGNDGRVSRHAAEVGVHDAFAEEHDIAVYDYRHNLYKVGSEVVTIQSMSSNSVSTSVDLILALGPGLPKAIVSSDWFRSAKAPKVLWNSESVSLDNYRSRLKEQKDCFDYYFHFSSEEIPIYNELKIFGVSILHQAFNPNWYNPSSESNQVPMGDLVFVGSLHGKWPNRINFLNRVMHTFSVTVGEGIFDATEVNKIYNQHKVVLNLGLHVPSLGPPENLRALGLQQRVFESIGAGRICVTHETPDNCCGLLEDGFNILMYNKNNLEKVIRRAIDDYGYYRSEVIRIRKQHTYKERIKKMLSCLFW